MGYLYFRKYGEAATLPFKLYEVDGVDFRKDATFAAGDIVVMKDEGAEVNSANLPTDEGKGYSLLASAAEMTAKRIVYSIEDQSGTKVWLDDEIIVETYGHTNAMHAFNLDYDFSNNTERIKLEFLEVTNNNVGEPAVALNANGTGAGAYALKCASANSAGIYAEGASNGIQGLGTGSGNGASFTASTGKGMAIIGTPGLQIDGTNEAAVKLIGGGTGSPYGLYVKGANQMPAAYFEGHGSGSGVQFKGGSTGSGGLFEGGATSGAGIKAEAPMLGHGLHCLGNGTNGHGARFEGQSDGYGLELLGALAKAGLLTKGGATGAGAIFQGGETSGEGIKVSTADGTGIDVTPGATNTGLNIWGGATGGNAVSFTPAPAQSGTGLTVHGGGSGNAFNIACPGGTGAGFVITPGNNQPAMKLTGLGTGAGLDINGGATGNALNLTTANGHGMNISAAGASKHAFYAASAGGIGAYLTGGGANPGLYAKGGVSGDGAIFQGGTTSGDGYRAMASGGNGNGASFHKNGTGKDIDADEIGNGITFTDVVDGTVTVAEFYQDLLAWMKGKSLRNTPNDGDIRFFRQDTTTPAFTVHVTDTQRTEV